MFLRNENQTKFCHAVTSTTHAWQSKAEHGFFFFSVPLVASNPKSVVPDLGPGFVLFFSLCLFLPLSLFLGGLQYKQHCCQRRALSECTENFFQSEQQEDPSEAQFSGEDIVVQRKREKKREKGRKVRKREKKGRTHHKKGEKRGEKKGRKRVTMGESKSALSTQRITRFSKLRHKLTSQL